MDPTCHQVCQFKAHLLSTTSGYVFSYTSMKLRLEFVPLDKRIT